MNNLIGHCTEAVDWRSLGTYKNSYSRNKYTTNYKNSFNCNRGPGGNPWKIEHIRFGWNEADVITGTVDKIDEGKNKPRDTGIRQLPTKQVERNRTGGHIIILPRKHNPSTKKVDPFEQLKKQTEQLNEIKKRQDRLSKKNKPLIKPIDISKKRMHSTFIKLKERKKNNTLNIHTTGSLRSKKYAVRKKQILDGKSLNVSNQIQSNPQSINFLVPQIAQPTWNACLPTAILMLVRWRNQQRGVSIYHSVLEEEVFAPRLFAIKEYHGRSLNDLSQMCISFQLYNHEIDIDPQVFLQELTNRGPFAYISTANNTLYQHTLVITGINNKNGHYYLRYNDPDGGRSNIMDFYDFILKQRPAFTKGISKALIVSPNK